MLVILSVTLYTFRVVLEQLGVEDFGLYNVVGGVVAVISFISGTLSFGTSRFITYELGTRNQNKLKLTFSTSLVANLAIGLIMFVFLESIGLWFVYNKLVIPDNRFDAALIVYQISLVTMLFNFLQIPYRSDIIAHEQMSVYAYVSIFEALGRLGTCYLITVGPFDYLVNYALFGALVQILTTLLYMVFCFRKYIETRFSLVFDKAILKNIFSFSGWNICANMSETFKLQGIVVIMNMFFMPAVIGAQAIANQIAGAIMQFVGNFRTAIDPQVIKLYAAGDYDASKKLTLSSTIYTFDLFLLLALPCYFLMSAILKLWLVEVPDYCLIFAQWTILQRIPTSISSSFFTPFVASGKIKKNSIVALICTAVQVIALLLIFKLGGDVMWVQYTGLIYSFIFCIVIRPILMHKEVKYSYREMFICMGECAKVFIPATIMAWASFHFIGDETLLRSAISLIMILFSVVLCSLIFMKKNDRSLVFSVVKKKINSICHS